MELKLNVEVEQALLLVTSLRMYSQECQEAATNARKHEARRVWRERRDTALELAEKVHAQVIT